MKSNKIDREFFDKVRTHFGISYFECVKKDIVPEQLTHESLINKYTINESILDYYYSPTEDLFSDSEFNEFISIGYAGPKNRYVYPYAFKFYGSYYSTKSLTKKLEKILSEKDKIHYKGKLVDSLDAMLPYFEDYSSGFKYGFDNFEKECVDIYLNRFSEKEDYYKKIHDFITNRIFGILDRFHYLGYLGQHNGLHLSSRLLKNGEIEGKYEIINAMEEGVVQGYIYRAWSIVFSDSEYFEHLFNPRPKKDNEFIKDKYNKEKAPFKICLLFAKGKPQMIYKNKQNYSEVARSCGFDESYKSYFSRTISNTVEDPKNLYSKNKLGLRKFVYQYCIDNNIEVVEEFKNYLQ